MNQENQKLSKKRLRMVMSFIAAAMILLPALYIYIFVGCTKISTRPDCGAIVPWFLGYIYVVLMSLSVLYQLIKRNKQGVR